MIQTAKLITIYEAHLLTQLARGHCTAAEEQERNYYIDYAHISFNY